VISSGHGSATFFVFFLCATALFLINGQINQKNQKKEQNGSNTVEVHVCRSGSNPSHSVTSLKKNTTTKVHHFITMSSSSSSSSSSNTKTSPVAKIAWNHAENKLLTYFMHMHDWGWTKRIVGYWYEVQIRNTDLVNARGEGSLKEHGKRLKLSEPRLAPPVDLEFLTNPVYDFKELADETTYRAVMGSSNSVLDDELLPDVEGVMSNQDSDGEGHGSNHGGDSDNGLEVDEEKKQVQLDEDFREEERIQREQVKKNRVRLTKEAEVKRVQREQQEADESRVEKDKEEQARVKKAAHVKRIQRQQQEADEARDKEEEERVQKADHVKRIQRQQQEADESRLKKAAEVKRIQREQQEADESRVERDNKEEERVKKAAEVKRVQREQQEADEARVEKDKEEQARVKKAAEVKVRLQREQQEKAEVVRVGDDKEEQDRVNKESALNSFEFSGHFRDGVLERVTTDGEYYDAFAFFSLS
jgi:hypothetical protein